MAQRKYFWQFVIDGDAEGGVKALKKTRVEIEATDKAEDKATKTRAKHKTGTDDLFNSIKRLAGPLSLGLLVHKFAQVTIETELLKGQLVTMTGSTDNASLAFKKLNEFAKETPFTLDQSVQGFIKLTALGLTPSERALKAYGNTASAMGKSLSQMIEAVADASTMEFERLKEFGIKTRQETDSIKFTFQGVTTEIGKNSDEIEAFLIGIGENKFGDAMENQMVRLPGLLSNLQDNVDNLFRAMADEGGLSAFEISVKGASSAIIFLTGSIEFLKESFEQSFAIMDGALVNFIANNQLLAIQLATLWEQLTIQIGYVFDEVLVSVTGTWESTIAGIKGLFGEFILSLAQGIDSLPFTDGLTVGMRKYSGELQAQARATETVTAKVIELKKQRDILIAQSRTNLVKASKQINDERDAEIARINAIIAGMRTQVEIIDDLEVALEDLANTGGESADSAGAQAEAVQTVIEKLEEELELINATVLEQEYANRVRGLTEAQIASHGDEIRRLIVLLQAEKDAQKDAADELKRSDEIRKNQVENIQKAIGQITGDFFEDLKLDSDSFFEFFKKGWLKTVEQAFAGDITALITGNQNTGISLSGILSGEDSAGGFNMSSLAGLASAGFGTSIVKSGSAAVFENGVQVSPATPGGANFSATNIGTNIAAGYAGGYVGTELGSAIFGKEAESNIGATIGGIVGSFIPVIGTFFGAAIGGAVDSATGGDGYKRYLAGLLTAPTEGADKSNLFNVEAFASGFQGQGIAHNSSEADARQIIAIFANLDSTITDLVDELGGNLDLSNATLGGVNVDGQAGTLGTFLGQGGKTKNFQAQVDQFAAQLASHISGLTEETMSQLQSASSVQEIVGILGEAVETLEATASATGDLTIAEQGLQLSREKVMSELETFLSNLAEWTTQAGNLARQLQTDINTSLGVATLRPGAAAGDFGAQFDGIEQARLELLAGHNDTIARERELHAERLRNYEAQISISKRLNETVVGILTGDLSPLNNEEKFNIAGAEFSRLAGLAEGGDLDAAGKLGASGQNYISTIRGRFASSRDGKDLTQDVLAKLQEVSGSIGGGTGPGEFDPTAANNRLTAGLSLLQNQLEAIQDTLARDTLNELIRINEQLGGLPFDISDAMDLPSTLAMVAQQLIQSGTPATVVADQIAGNGALTDAANTYLAGNGGGTVSDFTSARNSNISNASIQASADAVLAQAGSENEKILKFVQQMVASGVGSGQISDALGIGQGEVIRLARSVGLPEFAKGGIVSGPTIGLLGEAKKREMITPLPAGFNAEDMSTAPLVAEVRKLNTNVEKLLGLSMSGKQFSGQQGAETNKLLEDLIRKTEDNIQGVGGNGF